MIEEPLQFGAGGRLFGVLTRPDDADDAAPVSVFLNAGLLHRAGPHRLHVRLARRLAAHGRHSLRVDLGGIGDSLAPAGVTYPDSVAIDFRDILALLGAELGDVPVMLFGLCSGADNAIKLALGNDRVTELVLLDPVCEKDDAFEARASRFARKALATKAATPSRYMPALKRRIDALTQGPAGDSDEDGSSADSLSLRDLPGPADTRRAFELIRERNGRVLSVFTSYALRYYNDDGQLRRVLGIDDYDEFATELFWPEARHTYPLETHRARLIDAVERWATG